MPKFSDHDRKMLLANRYIQAVTESHVKFTPEFKLKALKMHQSGLRPSDIFLKLGIDPALFLTSYPKKCLARWKKIVTGKGEQGLKDERRGRPLGRKKVIEANDESLRERIAYLEAEVDFLKKLRALGTKSANKKSSR